MNTEQNQEQLQLRVIEYLYGEMTSAERSAFEQELTVNAALQAMLESEQGFDSAVPAGSQPLIDDERLQGNRWMLRQRLMREQQPRFTLGSLLTTIRQRPLTAAFQSAAMAMTFVLGVMVASNSPAPQSEVTTPGLLPVSTSPLAFIQEDDFEIYQLRVNNYDAASGEIDLSFSLASESRVTGNISDQNVHRLMAVALQDDIDSAARLDTINVLQAANQGDAVYEALIYVLLNDQNPGVRFQAVQSLVALSDDETVRAALRYALRSDVNQGVRVEAFNALADYRDSRTLQVFREQMENDSNEYIRTQARAIVESANQSEQEEFIF